MGIWIVIKQKRNSLSLISSVSFDFCFPHFIFNSSTPFNIGKLLSLLRITSRKPSSTHFASTIFTQSKRCLSLIEFERTQSHPIECFSWDVHSELICMANINNSNNNNKFKIKNCTNNNDNNNNRIEIVPFKITI